MANSGKFVFKKSVLKEQESFLCIKGTCDKTQFNFYNLH